MLCRRGRQATRTLATLAGVASIFFGALAAGASEAPSINVQANAPGWITVTYSHSGTGGVQWYRVERRGGGGGNLYSPNGQFTDSHLTPNTQYSYRVCAIYEGGDPACSGWVSAKTLPDPGKPANYDPPIIIDHQVATDSIKVTWGKTGDYDKILARIEDDRGNNSQRDLPSTPNGSHIFNGLRSGARYKVILKGCGNSLLGSGCGPWSPAVFITTAAPPRQAPPPSKPTLTVSAPQSGAVALAFAVKIAVAGGESKFLVYRDRKEIASVNPRSALDGLGGTYSETVRLWEQHRYQVCFLGGSPTVKVCSDTVPGPAPSIEVQPKPPIDSDILTTPARPDLGVVPKPRGKIGNSIGRTRP